jgi:hypothetical protein
MDYKLIDNVEFDNVDYTDYPDFCDAYICYAEYNGIEMTDEELDALNDDNDLRYDLLMEFIK